MVHYFIQQQLDSLITVKDEQVHCVYQGTPLNFRVGEIFAKTQDLTPVQPFVYSVMMWRTTTFTAAFAQRGYALLSGKEGYFPVSQRSTVLIKTPEDLQFAEALLGGRVGDAVVYDPRSKAVMKEAAA